MTGRLSGYAALVVLFLLTHWSPLLVAQLDGHSSVGAQLRFDDRVNRPVSSQGSIASTLDGLLPDLNDLFKDQGVTLGADYNTLLQASSQSPGNDFASGGVFRLYGQVSLLGSTEADEGKLVFKTENRHRYSTTSPQDLGGEMGYSGLTGITWSDAGMILSNLYWNQHLFNNRAGFVVGFVDATDYVDVYGLVNPWTDFVNSTLGNNATIAFPGQGFGAAFRYSFTDNVYLVAGLADANGDPTEPGDALNSFFTTGEYFRHLELGVISSWDERMEDNIHFTLWQIDSRPGAGLPAGWGGAFSFSRLYRDEWLPFVRIGVSDGGGGAPLKSSASLGLGRFLRGKSDLLAVGLHAGEPSSKSFGRQLRDEYTAELFYRIKVSEQFSVTPDLQFIINPALSRGADAAAVFGLRGRVVF